ncbi:DUF3311 domain-containing protein [Halosimplex halobium]|uniref:DUF3311 domain-containing protein n=1 Tax=Halosimplex halobium TaxID=3396618 RepID=UPI003F56362F
MNERTRVVGWAAVAVALAALAVPWFMWGADGVVAGLPVWVAYHVGWLCLVAVALWVFTRRAWGLGVEGVGRDG